MSPSHPKQSEISNANKVSEPALVSEGLISPALFQQIIRHNKAYFLTQNVPAEEQVRRTAYHLQPVRIQMWYESQQAALDLLIWDQFVTLLHPIALEPGWEMKERMELEDMKQNGKLANEFYFEIVAKNATLRTTTKHISDLYLRPFFHSRLDDDLRVAVTEDDEAMAALTLTNFVSRVAHIDQKLRRDHERMDARISRAQSCRPPVVSVPLRGSSGKENIHAGKPIHSKTQTTPQECDILRAFGGCWKCRHYHAGHRANECMVPEAQYNKNPITEQAGNLVRAHLKLPKISLSRTKKEVVAAISNADLSLHHQLPAHASMFLAGSSSHPLVLDDDDDNDDDEEIITSSHQDLVAAVRAHPAKPSDVLDYHTGSEDEPDSYVAPLRDDPLFWGCSLSGLSPHSPSSEVQALIDTGSSLVMIDAQLVRELKLRTYRLKVPVSVSVAISEGHGNKRVLDRYVKVKVSSIHNEFRSCALQAIVCPSLVAPIILGCPFLRANRLRPDLASRSLFTSSNLNVLTPSRAQTNSVLNDFLQSSMSLKERHDLLSNAHYRPDIAAAIRDRIEELSLDTRLQEAENTVRTEFKHLFHAALPPVDTLPCDVYHRFRLKDANQIFKTRSYSSPRKYKEAWASLIQEHLEAGRIRPSSSPMASPGFLVPKADKSALPRMVIDYRALNANTIPDRFNMPRVSDILADCAKGKIFGKIDMTNAFFQTRVHPDDVQYTAFTTPLGLYEWLVMPMGCRNAPATHQRRVNIALRPFLGKFCHAYMDDIILWSETVEDHLCHVRLILNALAAASLICSLERRLPWIRVSSSYNHESKVSSIHSLVRS